MQDHFGFSDEQMEILSKQKIGIPELFKFAKEFDPSGNMVPIGYINLLTYIDKKGDFTNKPVFKTKLICEQIFENLNIKDKIAVHEYMGDMEDGVF
ncbi:MAG: hypothetical protein K0U78_15410 [Actinomycetia bacterium]|nr:hypothetical protein [Actinomycetes bacterium]